MQAGFKALLHFSIVLREDALALHFPSLLRSLTMIRPSSKDASLLQQVMDAAAQLQQLDSFSFNPALEATPFGFCFAPPARIARLTSLSLVNMERLTADAATPLASPSPATVLCPTQRRHAARSSLCRISCS